MKMGIEIEYQLIDRNSFELCDEIDHIINTIGNDKNIDSEVFQSCIEIKTDPVADVIQAQKQIINKLQKVATHIKHSEIALCSLGVHPFSKRASKTTNRPRYLKFEKEFPYITRHLPTFSTHVHFSMNSLEQTIQVMNQMNVLLPVFMALSASSPYWQEEETGFISFRQYILHGNRNGGNPPYFENSNDFEKFMNAGKKTGNFASVKDIHWNIRPRPDLGTMEVRIMDAVPDIQDAMSIIALMQGTLLCLENSSLHEILPTLFKGQFPQWAIPMNYFQATHLGMDALFILNSEGASICLKSLTLELILAVEKVIPINQKEHLFSLKRMINNQLPYQKITDIFKKTQSFKEIVKYAIKEVDAVSDYSA